MNHTKTFLLWLVFSCFIMAGFVVEAEDYGSVKAKAEALVAEGSYAKANRLYKTIKTSEVSPADARWVAFRLADTSWRAFAQSHSYDNSLTGKARHDLEVLIRDIRQVKDRDLVWAEVEESLGDFYWMRRNSRDWQAAWPYYQSALEFWAGYKDVELARKRYLNIVWRIIPNWDTPWWIYNNGASGPIRDILENTLKIVQTPADQAKAHYCMAVFLARQNNNNWAIDEIIRKEFEAAIQFGKKGECCGAALLRYGQWLEQNGKTKKEENGNWSRQPDFVRALEIYRQFLGEFKKGENEYFDEVEQRVKNITNASLEVAVSDVFLPDSEIQFTLNWRNIKQIDYSLYPVDLTKDFKKGPQDRRQMNWLEAISLENKKSQLSSSVNTKDDGTHVNGSLPVILDQKLSPGAYLIEARAGEKKAHEMILVSDISIIAKTSGRQVLAYVCNAVDGSPVGNADVCLWMTREVRGDSNRKCERLFATKQTDTSGIVIFKILNEGDMPEILTAKIKDKQAFTHVLGGFMPSWEKRWKVFAYTDRPAYRPKETVKWKIIARQENGDSYVTPAGQVVEFEIFDSQGGVLKKGKLTLNSFGSAWDNVDLGLAAPLGEYNVTFWDDGRKNCIGNAILFRLEEYKLPEFQVNICPQKENGRTKVYRLGDRVSVDIQADYFFGGPVAGADVEVVVYQNGYSYTWDEPHVFPWFYENSPMSSRPFYGPGQVVKRQNLKTDANGRATVTFDTPTADNNDYEYRFEARVTDSSRREITGSGTVRVTRQGFYARLTSEHNLYRPQTKVTVKLTAEDVNSQPVAAEGNLRVTREQWKEVWLDPMGREITGQELRNIQSQYDYFPPRPKVGQHPWLKKFRGYQSEEILIKKVKTDTNGMASFVFTPEREGYYKIVWTGEDVVATNEPPVALVNAETTVWVSQNQSRELGFNGGELKIITDADTARGGEKMPVLLTTASSDHYVLFAVETVGFDDYRLIHITGDSKLIELPLTEKHVPNINLVASMVDNCRIFKDAHEVIVPPTKNFLTVDIQPERMQYQPREEGTFTLTTLNDENKPVPAEVSFGLVDESVYSIQQDYAMDIRRFFYGTKRYFYSLQFNSSVQERSYKRFVRNSKGKLVLARGKEPIPMDIMELEEVSVASNSSVVDIPGHTLQAVAYGSVSDASPVSELRGGISNVRAIGGVNLRRKMVEKMPMMASAAMPATHDAPLAAGEPSVVVRSDFRSTAFWQPDVKTGADGKATVKVKYPDSLTRWKATARAVTQGNQFGWASTNTQVKQPLIVRLESPRFFLVGDVLTVSAIVNNNTDKALDVTSKLEADRLVISGIHSGTNGIVKGEQAASVKVQPNGEARIDWAVSVLKPGTARLKVQAKGGQYGDAMEKTFDVYEHGIEKLISKSGKVRGNAVTVNLDLPRERKVDSTLLTVQVAPSAAVTMLDALPYLIDYPYGCTEQTMSRFLPAVIVGKTLGDLGLSTEDVIGRAFGGIETNSMVHSGGHKNLDKLNEVTHQGLERLYEFQHEDGGWGWWKDCDSDHFMTAYVVWGLALAKDADVAVKPDSFKLAEKYLNEQLVNENSNPDMQAWMLHALSTSQKGCVSPNAFQKKAFENTWKNRDRLNAYTRALLALSAQHFGYTNQARILVSNLENGVKRDNSPDSSVLVQGGQKGGGDVLGTAHWGEDGVCWRWSEGGVEATAFALKAMLAIDPTNKLVEPTVNWLVKNRRGVQWDNTRDTAIVVLALNDYLRVSGELACDLDYEVRVNGKSIARKHLSSADVFKAPSQYVIDKKWIRDGKNEIQFIRHSGKSPLYFGASARFFSLEEPVTPTGNEMFVRRQYFRLVARPTLLNGIVYDRVLMADGDVVNSGERVETVLTIETKNNYEYLLFEDLKPAGFEAVSTRSGEPLSADELKKDAVTPKAKAKTSALTSKQKAKSHVAAPKMRSRGKSIANAGSTTGEDHTGRSRGVYQELRDRKVALFIDKLPQGMWEIKYMLRAEIPGQFHALPVIGQAMYTPEIRCNGAETHVKVNEFIPASERK